MAKTLDALNRDLEANELAPRTERIFQSFVKIHFCAAAEKAVFVKQPSRIIQRRVSTLNSVAPVAVASTSAPRKQRSKSVDTRQYVAPADLNATIESIKQRLGEYLRASRVHTDTSFSLLPSTTQFLIRILHALKCDVHKYEVLSFIYDHNKIILKCLFYLKTYTEYACIYSFLKRT